MIRIDGQALEVEILEGLWALRHSLHQTIPEVVAVQVRERVGERLPVVHRPGRSDPVAEQPQCAEAAHVVGRQPRRFIDPCLNHRARVGADRDAFVAGHHAPEFLLDAALRVIGLGVTVLVAPEDPTAETFDVGAETVDGTGVLPKESDGLDEVPVVVLVLVAPRVHLVRRGREQEDGDILLLEQSLGECSLFGVRVEQVFETLELVEDHESRLERTYARLSEQDAQLPDERRALLAQFVGNLVRMFVAEVAELSPQVNELGLQFVLERRVSERVGESAHEGGVQVGRIEG